MTIHNLIGLLLCVHFLKTYRPTVPNTTLTEYSYIVKSMNVSHASPLSQNIIDSSEYI